MRQRSVGLNESKRKNVLGALAESKALRFGWLLAKLT